MVHVGRSTVPICFNTLTRFEKASDQSVSRLWATKQKVRVIFMKRATERLGEDISTLVTSRNMFHNNLALGNNMTNPVVTDINMFETIGGIVFPSESNTTSVVLIHRSGRSLRETNLRQNLTKIDKFLDAFSESEVFCLRRAERGGRLQLGIPGNGASSKHDDKS